MKIILFLLIILLCGCSNEKNVVENKYDNYKTVMPYKERISNFSSKSYDRKSLEELLSYISRDYFKTGNSLYQEGQYLSSEDIKKILLDFNNNQNYINTIYEQDYLNYEGKLKGISIAIIADSIDSVNYINENIDKIVKFIRNKSELKKIDILLTIYIDSSFKGCIKYLGFTNSDKIKMNSVNYNYQLIETNYILKNDINTYNYILDIKKKLENNNVYLNSYGIYNDKSLFKLKIFLNKDYFSKYEILNIAELIQNDLIKINSNTDVYFKSNNEIKAFLEIKNNIINVKIMEE